MGTRKNFVVPGGVTFDTNTLVVDDPNNRVGIKKSEPEYELDVAGIIKASNGVVTLTTAGEPSAESPDGTLAVDTTNDVFYFRSGGEWAQVSAGGASLTVSTTAPAEPGEGDLWYNSTNGSTYVYYDSFWVETGVTGFSSNAIDANIVNAKGDLIVGTADNTVGRLATGEANQVLVVDSGQPTGLKWSTLDLSAYIPKATIDAKGDLIVGTADDTVGRVAVGTNGFVLTADSAQTAGIKWAAVQGESFSPFLLMGA